MYIGDRATSMLDLSIFDSDNDYGIVETLNDGWKLHLDVPKQDQYVLRCLVKNPSTELRLPHFLEWVRPMLDAASEEQQKHIKVRHPYCYITVRHGTVKSQTDDEWHVDGFSMRFNHLPEQNYVWCSNDATEVLQGRFCFPDDFDPLKHNINWFLEDHITRYHSIWTIPEKSVCVFDPYVIHRRPPNTSRKHRTFIRITFSPLEIDDVNNTVNPFLPTNYTRDGVKDFRDKLTRYGEV